MSYWCLNDEGGSELTLVGALISSSDSDDADEFVLSDEVEELRIKAIIEKTIKVYLFLQIIILSMNNK